MIYGLGGHDVIDTYSGEDVVDGGAGNDTIELSGTADTVIASAGFDTVSVALGNDAVLEIPEEYSPGDVTLIRRVDDLNSPTFRSPD